MRFHWTENAYTQDSFTGWRGPEHDHHWLSEKKLRESEIHVLKPEMAVESSRLMIAIF